MKTNFLCIFLFFFIGCDKKDNAENPQLYAPLLNVQWNLTSIQNTKTKKIINFPDSISQPEWVLFSDSASLVSMSGSCNGGRGKYSITTGNNISISHFETTLIYCINYGWEAYLVNNIDSAYKFTLSSNQLEIYSNGSYNLNFVPAPVK